MLVRQLTPTVALRIAGPVALIAALLLALNVLPVLFTKWASITALVNSHTIVAIAAFVLVGLAVGHSLGGHDPDDRAVLALATATRHPGIALARKGGAALQIEDCQSEARRADDGGIAGVVPFGPHLRSAAAAVRHILVRRFLFSRRQAMPRVRNAREGGSLQ
jgi:uncharacterized membrane protein YuzA (DUF378 family)